jgi:hypothetical protein
LKLNGAAEPACVCTETTSGISVTVRATACATASVASTDEPSGMSMTTASSDLLSKGKSLTVTSLV